MAVNPISVPSDAVGPPTTQERTGSVIQSILNRLDTLERTSRLRSASIGEGGILVYDGGKFRWYNYNYDNQLPEEDNDGALVYEIGSFEPDDLEDFGVAFRYYFPNKESNPLPEVVIGAFDEIDGSGGDSHGILVQSHEGLQAVLAAISSDHLYFAKSKQSDSLTPQEVLNCPKDGDDSFTLWMGNEQHYYRVESDSSTQRAHILGGNSGAGYGVLIRIHGTSGADTRQVHFLNADNPANWVPVHASAFVTPPSSEAFKNIIGVKESDFLATVQAAPVKQWTKLHPDSATRLTAGGEVEDIPEAEQTFTERFSPSIEDLPDELVGYSDEEGESPGIDLGAALWTLWGAVQQQQGQIEALQAEIASLKAKR